jgi:flavodoxin
MVERTAGKKILVVYYSLQGNTARVARDIAARMDAECESIRDETHGTGFFGFLRAAIDALRGATANILPIFRDPASYTLTVIGTPVWVGRMTPAVRSYLQQNAGRFGRIAFFVTSGDTDVARLLPSLEAAAQIRAIASAGFNARELQDPATYEAKLDAFIKALDCDPVSPEIPIGEQARAV